MAILKTLPLAIKQAFKTKKRPINFNMGLLTNKKISNNGVIIYKGKSLLNGENIVVIMTGLNQGSANAKTGEMLQTWVLVDGKHPVLAHRDGSDFAVCGDCVHRGIYDDQGNYIKGRTCYVNLGQAPRAVIECYNSGGYLNLNSITNTLMEKLRLIDQICTGQAVRGGSYGDPAAVPAYIWAAAFGNAKTHTAYTHQWKQARFSSLKKVAMASADNAKEAAMAAAQGWRYFRVMSTQESAEKKPAKTTICPSVTVGLACSDCGACSGTESGRKAQIVIPVHGSGAAAFNAAA